MSQDRIIKFVEESFLATLLEDKDITDISYNGKDIFYQHNYKGRRKVNGKVQEEDVRNFVRQIANMSSKQFSFSNPILDISFGKYRFNTIHQSVGKSKNEDKITFSLRIGSEELKINNNGKFFPKEIGDLIDRIIDSKLSIVIGGRTGSGKTEFQKYLLSRMKDNTRVIVIDSVLELDSITYPNDIDLNIYQSDERNELTSIYSLVKNSLRCNPDWLIVAESRGKEMIEILNSSMTGHPIITTLHSFNAESMPKRMARMILSNNVMMDINGILDDIYMHIPIYIYLEKDDTSKEIKRYIKTILFIDQNGNVTKLYGRDNDEMIINKIPDELLKLLNFNGELAKKQEEKEEKDECIKELQI